jgi:hypothetical protein
MFLMECFTRKKRPNRTRDKFNRAGPEYLLHVIFFVNHCWFRHYGPPSTTPNLFPLWIFAAIIAAEIPPTFAASEGGCYFKPKTSSSVKPDRLVIISLNSSISAKGRFSKASREKEIFLPLQS